MLVSRPNQISLAPHIASPQIGNLSFYTTEEQIHDMFSKCANPEDGGGVKRIIMGLDRHTRYDLLFITYAKQVLADTFPLRSERLAASVS